MPTMKHASSSQVVELRDKLFMIDCGEGTQMQLRRYRIHFSRIQAVFLSHLHGDHCFGIPGMISTFGMTGRTAPLHIYAPASYEPILQQTLHFFCQSLEFKVEYHPLDTTKQAVILKIVVLQWRLFHCSIVWIAVDFCSVKSPQSHTFAAI